MTLNRYSCMLQFPIFTLAFALLAWHGGLYADAAMDQMPVRDQGLWQTLSMVAIAIAFFYLILWRPEQKRRKAADELRANLKKGDRVTAMGIIGTVARVQDQTVILKMYDGSKIECLKLAISDVVPGEGEEKESGAHEEK